MDRLNLTQTAARTRIKYELNLRYREIVTSLGLGLVRRGLIQVSSVTSQAEYDTIDTGTSSLKIIKPISVMWNPTPTLLGQVTLQQLRKWDPDLSQEGTPQVWALVAMGATSCTIRLWPQPDVTTANCIIIDGLLIGTDMSADADVPAFPEDFHDVLERMVIADELDKQEKPNLAAKQEKKADVRLKELRYFIAKTAYLHQTQGSDAAWWWPVGGLFAWRV